jgi:hypothetical protein
MASTQNLAQHTPGSLAGGAANYTLANFAGTDRLAIT